jgi:hypothetical protein
MIEVLHQKNYQTLLTKFLPALLLVSLLLFARALVDESGMIRTQMGDTDHIRK